MMQATRYELDDLPANLLALLDRAAAHDKVAERKAGRFGCLLVVAVLLVVGLGLLSLVVFPPALVLVLPMIAVPVALGLRMSHWKRYDLDDRKLDAALHTLRTLSLDVDPARPLHLELDFRDYRKGGRCTERESEGGVLGRAIRRSRYEHEWLHLTGRLLDGNAFSVRLAERVARTEKSKRKYVKVKERTRSEIVVQVKVDPQRYPKAKRAVGLLRRLGGPGALALRSARFSRRRLTVTLRTGTATKVRGRASVNWDEGREHLVTGTTLLTAMLWTYRALTTTTRRAPAA